MSNERVRYLAVDTNGVAQVYSYNVADGADDTAVLAAIVALVAAGIPVTRVTVTGPDSGQYSPTDVCDVLDAARLTFATAGGQPIYLLLPAAPGVLYLPDGETVDPTAIAGLIAACTSGGNLSTRGGDPAVQYIAGVRIRVPMAPVGRSS